MTRRRRGHRLRWRSVFLWHRYMGLVAAVFVVTLALTGTLLNHTKGLGLASRFVQSEILLDWYGIAPPHAPVTFRAGERWISQIGDQLYIDEAAIPGEFGALVGVVTLGGVIVAATDSQFLLFTPRGEPLERLTRAHGVPGGIRRVGVGAAGQLVIEAADGGYATDQDFLRWRRVGFEDVTWARAASMPDALAEAMAATYLGSSLSLERVLLDVHSGRIVGAWGVYFMDGVAVLMVLVVCAGVWLWVKRKH